jgi:hypothetical protein
MTYSATGAAANDMPNQSGDAGPTVGLARNGLTTAIDTFI